MKFDDSLRGYAFEVLQRDGFRCRYCGLDGQASFDNWLQLSWDHLLPKGHPDRDDPTYIVCACNFCNTADNRYFDLAAGRGLIFLARSTEELVEQRRPFVMATREAYRRFWGAHVSSTSVVAGEPHDLHDLRKRFITETARVLDPAEAVRNAILASLQRNPTYSSPNADGRRFRDAFASAILGVSDLYLDHVTDDEHVRVIQTIADHLSAAFPAMLNGGRLRIGTVQKALNLYLKTMWCLELTRPSPPRCSIDGIILTEARIGGKWTELDEVEVYMSWIEKRKVQASRAGFSSLAEWELVTWGEANVRLGPPPSVAIG